MLLDFNGGMFLAGLALLLLILALLRLRGRGWAGLFFAALFGLYLLVVIKTAIFPIHVPPAGEAGSEPFVPNINLVPFYSACWPGRLCLTEMIGNVLLTLPFGFLLPFVARFRARHILWLGPLVGMVLEGTQLILSLVLRSAFRAVDINDVLLNTLGVWLGYGLFLLFAWLYRLLERPLHGLLAHLSEVTHKR